MASPPTPPWNPGTSPPRSPKRPRTTTYPPESAVDSIQGEQSVPSQDDPVAPDPAHRPKQQVTLHSDIYFGIVDQVVKYGKQRDGSQSIWKKTLLSLACTSRLLQDIVEKHIYKYPFFCRWNESVHRLNLDHAVNMFLLALSERTSRAGVRASVVRSLGLTYSGRCSNIEPLIQIVQACPNLGHLSLEWSPRTLLKDLQEQARDVMRLLGSCSKKVRHFTFVKYDVERPVLVQEASRSLSKFYEGLTSFTAAAPASDLTATLSSHYLPDLKYFRLEQVLDQHPYRQHSARLLLEVSRTCPTLQTLDWGVTLFDLPSLQEACKVWRPTLRSLRVRINDTTPNLVSQILPLLPHLEELSVRTARQITRSDIEAIVNYARSTPLHLRNISLESRDHPMLTPGLPPIDDVLAKLIDAVHPTLESLHLEYDCPVDPEFLRHLGKAKKLHHIYVKIKGPAKEEDLELLSRECPRLKQINFPSLSSARSLVPAPLY